MIVAHAVEEPVNRTGDREPLRHHVVLDRIRSGRTETDIAVLVSIGEAQPTQFTLRGIRVELSNHSDPGVRHGERRSHLTSEP